MHTCRGSFTVCISTGTAECGCSPRLAVVSQQQRKWGYRAERTRRSTTVSPFSMNFPMISDNAHHAPIAAPEVHAGMAIESRKLCSSTIHGVIQLMLGRECHFEASQKLSMLYADE